MGTFMSHGETSVGQYHIILVEYKPQTYRVYASPDSYWLGHFETFEDPRDLCDILDSLHDLVDPRLFEAHPVTPFRREEVLAAAPHAFDGHVAD